MKKGSAVLYVLRLAVTLLLITAIVAALLSLVNGITAPIIAKMNEEKIQEAVRTVLPGGGDPVEFTDDTGLVTQVYQGENGYAVQVAPVGFDGEITMMVGIGPDGKVLGISIINQTETAGLGAVCAAKNSAGQAFRDQFIGMSGTLAVEKDGGEVDAITSATITSRAVTEGVNAALACVARFG
ncbi:MAG: RnfABCDGE type electron transport complex subunit G [Ruminococcaceae bacterium]|nr:RnfABCDGE type electron transport complex subunit G [Oscillospiraceae bacterium]